MFYMGTLLYKDVATDNQSFQIMLAQFNVTLLI